MAYRGRIYDAICPECRCKMTIFALSGPIGYARCDACGFRGPILGHTVVPADVKRRGNISRQERYWPEVVEILRYFYQLE